MSATVSSGAGLRPEPFTLVIFGATGDLTNRKLLPALYQLFAAGRLPEEFTVVGFSRRPAEEFHAKVGEALAGHARDPGFARFREGFFYTQGDFEDADAYRRLSDLLGETDRKRGTCGNRLYYLATPPSAYEAIVAALGKSGLVGHPRRSTGGGWTRIIVEKPYGHDLESARALTRTIQGVFAENQVYRIDHYLGKETVQNLLVFRFGNGIFEPLWNRQFIDCVQITVAESLGVEGRGEYYDQTGAIRDIVQNHLLQLLTLVTMEPPVAFSAEAVRGEKVKVLKAIRSLTTQDTLERTIRGQYQSGVVGGRAVPGYREEPRVAPGSRTETFVALKLFVDNWRWSGVPFYLYTGKRLPSRTTDIAIWFRRAPHLLFRETNIKEVEPNLLLVKIQPEEGITLRFGAKVPGPAVQIETVDMDFSYSTSFRVPSRDAYERLLLDAMLGEQTLFTREDEVEEAWRVVTSILEGWRASPPDPLPTYPAGTWGPEEVDALLKRDGRHWHHWA